MVFLYGPSLQGSCIKVRALYFGHRLSKSFLYGIIIFQTKTNFLQDLHIVWYVVLIRFINRLSGIKLSGNKTG